MQWRLNVMTLVAKGILMGLLILGGASIVRNVTVALHTVTGACETGITHLL